jgi:hypothetical protein
VRLVEQLLVALADDLGQQDRVRVHRDSLEACAALSDISMVVFAAPVSIGSDCVFRRPTGIRTHPTDHLRTRRRRRDSPSRPDGTIVV